jgi:predicted Fe-S protein YdhL (DUF1289 family)
MTDTSHQDPRKKMPERINIVSPCVSVCELDDSQDYCHGCHRTVEEIGMWRMADAKTKAKILCRAYLRWLESGDPDPDDDLAVMNHEEMRDRFRLMGFEI